MTLRSCAVALLLVVPLAGLAGCAMFTGDPEAHIPSTLRLENKAGEPITLNLTASRDGVTHYLGEYDLGGSSVMVSTAALPIARYDWRAVASHGPVGKQPLSTCCNKTIEVVVGPDFVSFSSPHEGIV